MRPTVVGYPNKSGLLPYSLSKPPGLDGWAQQCNDLENHQGEWISVIQNYVKRV